MADEYRPYLELVEELIQPLTEATGDSVRAELLLRDLGYAPPSEVLAFNELMAAINAVNDLIRALKTLIAADDREEMFKQLAKFVVEAGRAIKDLNDFSAKIQANFAGSPLLTLTDIVAALPRKLVDYLIVKFLEDYHPTLFGGLLVAGVVDLEDIDDEPTPFHVAYRKRSVIWDQIPKLLSDPLGTIKANFDGGDELLYERFLYLLRELGLGLGMLPSFDSPRLGTLRAMNRGTDLTAIDTAEELPTLYFPIISDPLLGVGFDVYPMVDPASRKYTGLALGLRVGAAIEFPISDAYKLEIKMSANVADGLGVRMERGLDPTFVSSLSGTPPEVAASVQFGLKFSIVPTGADPARKLLKLGAPGGARFEIGSGSLALGIERLDVLNLFVEGDLKDGLLELKAAEGDGFISMLLPKEGIQSSFNLGVGISNRAGLYFKGSSSLLIRLPVHIELGPISIDYLSFELGFRNGEFPLTISSGFTAKLGPIAAVVEDVGVRAIFKVSPNRTGSLGPLDVGFGFKPPKGVGLSINAGVVKGGGYLFFDFDREEYAGALELTISDFLSLKAIGLITTRMPDGSRGFSMIIIITAEFSPGLQLGYGFTLIGVGGLLGLNRTVVLEALALGVRTGAVNGMLFPVDPVANAPRIISDLRVIFPPYAKRFLIGPMAKLGWGTPTLVSLALGVIIEIPGNVAILGILKAVLPTEEAALLKLQVNFIGAIEFDKKRGWFFAALFESRLVFITIEGEMGMLIALGADANFILSVGGFHPRYSPPPLPFPSPRRISFDIINTPVARIRVEGYFAVTTNTVQAGARAELFFGFDSFSVQGHFAFDALLRFSPFYLIVEVSAGASLKAFGVGVFSIDLKFTLEGPTPWRARGRGSVSLLFIEISANFDRTFGESRDTTLPPILVVPLLEAEFAKAVNWHALPPAGANLLVSLRKLELPGDELVLHPLGTLEVSQNAVPLGFTLDRVGAQKPADADRFSLAAAGGGLAKKDDARRSFAPAQFRQMNDAQKLSAPPFQDELSGLKLGVAGAELRTGRAVRRSLRYEVTTIDTLYRRFVRRFETIGTGLFGHLILGNAITKSTLSRKHGKSLRPFDDRIEVLGEKYAVVFSENNVAAGADTASFASENAAREWLRTRTGDDPNLGATMHVVPVTEMSRAA
jgi:hypothetical protein